MHHALKTIFFARSAVVLAWTAGAMDTRTGAQRTRGDGVDQ